MATIPVVTPYGMYHTNFAPLTGTAAFSRAAAAAAATTNVNPMPPPPSSAAARSHALPPPTTSDTAALRAQLDALQEEVRQLRAARATSTMAAGPTRRKRVPTTGALRPVPTTTLVFGRHQSPPQSRPTSKGRAAAAATKGVLPTSNAADMAVHPLSLQHSPQAQTTTTTNTTTTAAGNALGQAAIDRPLASMQAYNAYVPYRTNIAGSPAIEVRMSAEGPQALPVQGNTASNVHGVVDTALKEENALLRAELVVLRDTLRQRDELLRKATHALHEVETRRQAARLAAGSNNNNSDSGAVNEDRVTVRLLSDELLQMQRQVSELTQAKAKAEEQQRLAEILLDTREQELRRLRAQGAGAGPAAAIAAAAGDAHTAEGGQRVDATTNTEADAAATQEAAKKEEEKQEQDAAAKKHEEEAEVKSMAERLAMAVRKVEAWETWYRKHYHRSGKPRTSHRHVDAGVQAAEEEEDNADGRREAVRSRYNNNNDNKKKTMAATPVPWSAMYDIPTRSAMVSFPAATSVPYVWPASRPATAAATPPAQTSPNVNLTSNNNNYNHTNNTCTALQLAYPASDGVMCELGLETIEFLAKEAALRELADKERAAAERRLATHRAAAASATSEAEAGDKKDKDHEEEGTRNAATPPAQAAKAA